EFAVISFIELVADKDAMPKDGNERPRLIAAAMTRPLREAWGPPFPSDKETFGYNPLEIHKSAVKVGGGTSNFSGSRVNKSPDYTIELTKPGGKATYTVKLVKGDRPNEWLVSEVVEAKKG